MSHIENFNMYILYSAILATLLKSLCVAIKLFPLNLFRKAIDAFNSVTAKGKGMGKMSISSKQIKIFT